MRQPTDDFTEIEVAFLCWARMHATGARHWDVSFANRLNGRAELIEQEAEVMSSSPLSPYRPTRLRATFEDWIVNEDAGGPMLKRTIPGKFVIEIRMGEAGRRTIFQAMVAGTLQKFGKQFAQSALDECKDFVRTSFREQLTDWEEI